MMIQGIRCTSASALGHEEPITGAPVAEADSVPLLPAPAVTRALASCGDIGAELAALLMKSALAQKKDERDAQQAAEQCQVHAEADEIHAMRQQADDMRVAAVVSGFATGAAGCMNNAGAKALTTGYGTIVEGYFKGAEKDHEADAKQFDRTAGHAKNRVDDAREGA